MRQRMSSGYSNGEKYLTLLVILVLLFVSFCLLGVICESTDDYYIEAPPVVTAANNGTAGDGPRIIGGFVPERHYGIPPERDSSVFLSWDFINALFAIIIVFELVVFPLLFWLWFSKPQQLEEQLKLQDAQKFIHDEMIVDSVSKKNK